jgi:dTMP kinase
MTESNLEIQRQAGLFVVIEGLDGAGTTTQTERLVERLQTEGLDAVSTREPSDGPVGLLVRDMLSRRILRPTPMEPDGVIDRESLALLFAADRLDHIRVEIDPALRRGAIVISDRYVHSSYVYQGDVDEDESFDIAWIRALNGRARQADLTFFLKTPVDVCLSRISSRSDDRDLFETREKLTRLHRRYDQVFDALENHPETICVDGDDEATRIHEHIFSHVLKVYGNRPSGQS